MLDRWVNPVLGVFGCVGSYGSWSGCGEDPQSCERDAEDDGKPDCPRLCDLDFQEVLLDCDEAECIAAREAYERCHRTCGVDVPDIPEPDPCLSQCDRGFQARLEACFDRTNADGRTRAPGVDPEPDAMDEDCFATADAGYVACLSGCGVEIPAPPPPHPEDEECLSHCDQGYEDTFLGCFDEATGEVDRDCVARVDRAYLGCLHRCGVEVPDEPELPGPTGNACVFRCDEGLLGGIYECYSASGELNLDCVVGLFSTFEECRSSCAGEEQDSILAAALRQSQTEALFVRGDATRDGLLELTDAVLVLDSLFIRRVDASCYDAHDSNDDGTVDIVDPVRLLSQLFLGADPLPPPTGTPGRDPTPDSLSCR